MIPSDELTRRIVLPYVGDTETLVDEQISCVVNGRTGFLSVLSIIEITNPVAAMMININIDRSVSSVSTIAFSP
jgi:hypothetical protein